MVSCQVSNVTLVERCWESFYASVKARMVEPVPVLAYSAFQPLRELPQVINELAIQVLNATLHLALILRVRRMSKMRFNAMRTAPSFPLLLKLLPKIGKNSLRQMPLLLQNSHRLSRR